VKDFAVKLVRRIVLGGNAREPIDNEHIKKAYLAM
jgi:hypothetical protein